MKALRLYGRSLQYKYLIDKGFDVLFMTENVDEFMVKMMNGYDGKPFKSITDNDIHAATEDEKKAMEEKQEENKDLLDAIKAAFGRQCEGSASFRKAC